MGALAAGAVALAGVVLLGAVVRLATGHSAPAAQRIALQASNPAASPPGHATPLATSPTPTPTPTATPSPTPRATPTPAPPTIANNRLQARRDHVTALQAMTVPGTTCSIVVGYSPAPQLAPATSNGAGAVSWGWRVSDEVQPGTYPIQVSCGGGTAGATITVI